MIEATPPVTDRHLSDWWRDASPTYKLVVYMAVVLTISLIVQVIATVFLGGLHV
jgi:hypothetical protein